MGEIIQRIVWFAIVASACAYATFLVAGSIVNAQASGAYEPILIRDELAPGAHHLSGMIMVPTPCDELTVRTETLSISTYVLVFNTWHEPTVTCAQDETPRYFRAVLFAPAAGVQFSATLDGVGLPIVVLPVVKGPPRQALVSTEDGRRARAGH
ncbi:hypothetical protein A2851_02805 [Candidatus Kaiserbacteria bacterium RIFCSPHIGHO2_01_FULL_53_29]|uniref:Uncharacterized protein n=1 Tax=Candidatus Kaiserbacteria bacterium RIFCSPHIGHO2_01_FULL_53_29 TaxID=1798480 RepID=A0A1F6CVL6_9BACT|nr:MAG: hypothetical protein A2851_02805 [Candidatus Kaiserbacteria bacterium RIFCSPHIGHO2_01_FULL_53_29]